jgi:hypothetical protein
LGGGHGAQAQRCASPQLGVEAWWRVPGLAAGLLLIERELVRLAGMPNEQLRTLQLAGRAPADPVAPVITLLAVMAEGLIGYLLALLVLGRSAC